MATTGTVGVGGYLPAKKLTPAQTTGASFAETVADQKYSKIVTDIYRQELGREPDAAGLAFYKSQLRNNTITPEALAAILRGSPERAPTAPVPVIPRADPRETLKLNNIGVGAGMVPPNAPPMRLAGPMKFTDPEYRAGIPMGRLTAQDLGTQFVAPENLSEVFMPYPGYTTYDPSLTQQSPEMQPLVNNESIAENPAAAETAANVAEGGAVGMAKGGNVPKTHGLHNVAQQLASKGRKGDTTLVHMTQDEVKGLQALAQAKGGSLTINPETGLVEAGFLSSLFKGILKIVPFVAPFLLGPIGSAVASGIAGGFGGEGGGFNLKRGLMSGVMSYGLGSLAKGASAAGTSADAATQAATTGTAAATDASARAMASGAGQVTGQTAAQALGQTATQAAGQTATQALGQTAAPGLLERGISAGKEAILGGTPVSFKDTISGLSNMATDPAAREAFTKQMAGQAVGTSGSIAAATMGSTGVQTEDATTKYKQEQEAMLAAENERNERMRQRVYEIMRSNPLPTNFSMAAGGIAGYAEGGAPKTQPRMLNGGGDGMSDSIPATINGTQPARLADGEFVIPADIVSHLGNGSSKAGSKQLYSMMDRIRKARTGTQKQAPEVNVRKYMPA